ncbi:nitrate/nitrite transporter NarK [Pseudoduganella flava]|uniref:MFS transporter n=1 Tax=Pseudoduganella flava TaxID=871742 RepID=A0A562PHS2_9BURK|nr:MFS transporter [Pseudoduganella flava]QGZ40356.1 MFS transporter [Pseudoduganella flava]TWI43546.1 nitrate/nitrite transporter NarK [Pseudoduganella flava]
MKSSKSFPKLFLTSPLAAVLCGGIIVGLALGMRHVQGLFMLPMTGARGWSREAFALAIALQNLVWGIAQPFTGMIADRWGVRRVLVAGCLLYALGLYLMAHAVTGTQLALSAGLLIGIALSGTTFGTVYGAISRIVPPARRSWALGLAGAVGGVGQFAMVPATQGLIGSVGWMAALVVFALVLALALPLAWPLDDRTAQPVVRAQQAMGQAIREALAHKGFWLLNLGFLACGFQLAFIAGHFPAYLVDRGFGAETGVVALAIVALANVGGTYLCGQLGSQYRRKHLLAYLYLIRSATMLAFVLLPVSTATVYAFAFVMGLTWLGTVPLTNGLVSQVFGVQYIGTLFGFVFVGHQLGGFLGMWLGGALFDATHSYDAMWLLSVLVGLVAAALHWPIDDRAVVRLQAA